MDQQYEQVLQAQRQLPGALDPGYAAQHRALLEQITQLAVAVEREGLFSANEEQDDISTSSLKFINVWYLFGQALDASKLDPNGDQIVGRMLVLHSAIRAYLNFCGVLHDYQVLPPPLALFYKRVSSGAQFDLTKSPPASSREAKIQMYALSRGANEVWLQHREKLAADKDEETQREAYFAKIGYEAIEAWKNITSNAQELELLASMAGIKREDALREGCLRPTQTTFADAKLKDNSTRIDIGPGSFGGPGSRGPIVGKGGKILRPFTLTRQQARNTVMGTGQVLPSMTVEEFVDQELRNGGMAKPQEDELEDDEDDMEFQDRETERLRRWDEFTEANPKGSGNTMNLG